MNEKYDPIKDKYTMYGAEFSLYSGKVRSYLRKKGIPFVERLSDIKAFKNFIVPRTGVKFIPVVQTSKNIVIQDTTDIIDTLEVKFPKNPVYPDTPKQKLTALLLEVYGDEWYDLNPNDDIPRMLGTHQFKIADTIEERAVIPYSLWMWQRPYDYYHSLHEEQRLLLKHWLEEIGLYHALNTPIKTRVKRLNNFLLIDNFT